MFRDWLLNVLNYLGFAADEAESGSSDSQHAEPAPEPLNERLTFFLQMMIDLPVILAVLRIVGRFLA